MKKILLFTLIGALCAHWALAAQPEASQVQKSKPVITAEEVTFGIIKPDSVAAGSVGFIIDLIELHGFDIVGMEKKQLTKTEAEAFYAVHNKRLFFKDLVSYMTSGPVVLLALKKENAIKDWRTLMGATDPKQSAIGTIRKMFGTDITKNSVHGSDSAENAALELKQFFPKI
jgi:nucleoside-diphosphate kinase